MLVQLSVRRSLVLASAIAENGWVDVDRLRAETRNEHEAVEGLVPLMDAALTRERYIDTLRRMHSVVHGWEQWAAAHAPQQYQSMLLERQRSPLIQDDLKFLGAKPASGSATKIQEHLTAHFLQGNGSRRAAEADFLGAMYVMEGSTLGGQYIARFVEEKLNFAEGKGDAYFRGYLDHTGSMWHSFKQNLVALPDDLADQVIAAARFMFRAFGAAMTSEEQ